MKYTYPCSICIVASCCTTYCNTRFKFMNEMADCWEEMTPEQKSELKNSISENSLEILKMFIETNGRYNIESINYLRRYD